MCAKRKENENNTEARVHTHSHTQTRTYGRVQASPHVAASVGTSTVDHGKAMNNYVSEIKFSTSKLFYEMLEHI